MREKFGEDLWRAYVGSYLNKTFGLDIGYTMMDYVKEQDRGLNLKSWMQSLGEALYNFFISHRPEQTEHCGTLAGWRWNGFGRSSTKSVPTF